METGASVRAMNDNDFFARRTKRIIEAQVLRGKILLLIHLFFSSRNYTLVDPPILHEQIPNKKNEIYLSEFQDRYSLSASNALFMGAYAALFGKVYAITPAFRYEQESVNHLTEFRVLEVDTVGLAYKDLSAFVEYSAAMVQPDRSRWCT